MIPPESSGASRTKVAWCNRGGPAVESACRATVRAITPARPGGPPRVRRAPSPPPIGHDSPPAPPRAVTSRRPDPDQPTPCDHSTPHTRHVPTTHGPPRSHELPLAAPPRDSSCDLGETHAARRAITPARPGGPPRVRRAPAPPPTGRDSPPVPPRAVTSRQPDTGQPTPCDHSTPHTRHVLTTHRPPRSHQLPLAAPPGDSSCDLREAHAARRATSPPPPGGPPRVRPSPPPIGHDSPPAPPRAVTSRRPDPGQPTPSDHSTPHTRHVLTTHGPPRSHELPVAAPPHDRSCDLGEAHAARRATETIWRTRQLPREQREER